MAQLTQKNRTLHRLDKAQHCVCGKAFFWFTGFSTQAEIVYRWDVWKKRVTAGTNFGRLRQSSRDAVFPNHLLQRSLEFDGWTVFENDGRESGPRRSRAHPRG